MKAVIRTVFLLFVLFTAVACVRVSGPQEIGFDESRMVTALGLKDLDGNGRPELIAVVADKRQDVAGFERPAATFVYLFERPGTKRKNSYVYLWQSGPMGHNGPDGRMDGAILERVRSASDGAVISGPDEAFHLSFTDGHYLIERTFERTESDTIVPDTDLPSYLRFTPDNAVWLNRGARDYLFTLESGRIDIRLSVPIRRNPFVKLHSFKVSGAILLSVGADPSGKKPVLIVACDDGRILVYGLAGL
jgi:hypothetical protein